MERFKEFPLCGSVNEAFNERCQDIFNEIFGEQVDSSQQDRIFVINDKVVARAIDLVSGLLHQLNIFMDNSQAPIWNDTQMKPIVTLSSSSEQSVSVERKKKKFGKQNYLLNVYVYLLFHSWLCI